MLNGTTTVPGVPEVLFGGTTTAVDPAGRAIHEPALLDLAPGGRSPKLPPAVSSASVALNPRERGVFE
jgi:hypothetical protein